MTKPPRKNVRHDFSSEEVTLQITKTITALESTQQGLYARIPADFKHVATTSNISFAEFSEQKKNSIDAYFNECIRKEREYYALVRIIELPLSGPRFILVYGETNDDVVTLGTGPFDSIQKARNWFLKSGR